MIQSFEVKNFKAIESAKVEFTPLTAFIGYNGVGKSSLVEALETYKFIVTEGLNAGMAQFRGFEHVYYKGMKQKGLYGKEEGKIEESPILFAVDFSMNIEEDSLNIECSTAIAQEVRGKQNVYFLEENYVGEYFEFDWKAKDSSFFVRPTEEIRHKETETYLALIGDETYTGTHSPDKSLFFHLDSVRRHVHSWQFLSMNTFLMGNPVPQKRTGGDIVLAKDGSNIAEYLLAIREESPEAFDGIIETLQNALPYAKDLQPMLTSELERLVYVQLSEKDFKVPGWLLSTGTLKLLALLAVFRNPSPSPLVVIEELENGLDPRSINLIVDEIRNFVAEGKSQVIITTHSPYLLDLLHLSQIVFVEREDGKVVFKRPYDSEQLRAWANDYTIGEMYTKELIQRFS